MRYGPAEQLVGLLLELASARSGLTIADIMDRFCVSRRTAERLLAALQRLVFLEEVEPWEDRRKRWRLGRVPAALTAAGEEELAGLQLAVARFEADGLDAQAEALRQLQAKLMVTGPAAQARRLEPDLEALAEAEGFALRPGPRQRIDPDTFSVLRFAIKARRKVRIDYRYRGSGRTGYQTVHPYGFLYGNRHYLVAYSENERAKAVRMFALLNVTAATLLDGAFAAQPHFSLRSFAGQSFGVFQERPAKVAWRFSAKAAPDAREFNFHPTQRLIEQPDGSLIVELEAGGLLEMCWHLVTWGGEVEILRPKRLQRLMEEMRASCLSG
jgi:predicted DNA-binding transcriptional regulator YafY